MQRPVCTRRGGHLEFARRLRRPWQVSGPGTLRPSETNRRSALRVPEGTGVETWEHPINPARLSGNRPMATFITLVHGTWARRAKWIQPDSALARYLSDNVAGPVHVTTPPFTWSGSNRLSARLKAAENLRRHLLDQVRDHPNDAHYVIGHSHGGSVAAYAIQDCEDLRVRVRLICLSTPFLQLELNALSGSTALSFFFLTGGSHHCPQRFTVDQGLLLGRLRRLRYRTLDNQSRCDASQGGSGGQTDRQGWRKRP